MLQCDCKHFLRKWHLSFKWEIHWLHCVCQFYWDFWTRENYLDSDGNGNKSRHNWVWKSVFGLTGWEREGMGLLYVFPSFTCTTRRRMYSNLQWRLSRWSVRSWTARSWWKNVDERFSDDVWHRQHRQRLWMMMLLMMMWWWWWGHLTLNIGETSAVAVLIQRQWRPLSSAERTPLFTLPHVPRTPSPVVAVVSHAIIWRLVHWIMMGGLMHLIQRRDGSASAVVMSPIVWSFDVWPLKG